MKQFASKKRNREDKMIKLIGAKARHSSILLHGLKAVAIINWFIVSVPYLRHATRSMQRYSINLFSIATAFKPWKKVVGIAGL